MATPSPSTDNLPTSSSLPSDLYLTPELVERACRDACERIQLVADLLLLQSNTSSYHAPSTSIHSSKQPAVLEPISKGNESYSKSRDAIVANSKGLAISVKDLGHKLNKLNLGGVYRTVQNITEQVVILTEAATHAAYFTALTDVHCKPATPGVADRYSFERARQAVHMSYDMFKPDYVHSMTRNQVLQISRTFANNLGILTQGCKLASENKSLKETDRSQFSNCVQCLQGTTSAFLASLKLFASSHSEENRKRCLLFGRPVLAAVDSTVEFTRFPQFAGKPAELTERGYHSQTEILGGAMAVVSSSIQLLETAENILDNNNSSNWQKMVNCTKAVADSSRLLSSSIRDQTPMPSRRPSADQPNLPY